MNANEAMQLADKIDRSWRNGIDVEIWTEALKPLDFARAEATYFALRDSEDRAPNVAQFRAKYAPSSAHKRDGHSLSCICGGSGWMAVPQTNGIDTWEAWARCPNGPHTSFVEPDKDYDPVAGAAAFETFDALAATAETRADLANACFAAAAAYANAERKTLL